MSFEQQHVKDRIHQYRIGRRILIVFILFGICIMNISGALGLGFIILGAVGLKYLVKYSDKYAAEQKDLNKLVEQIDRIANGELTATTGIEEAKRLLRLQPEACQYRKWNGESAGRSDAKRAHEDRSDHQCIP